MFLNYRSYYPFISIILAKVFRAFTKILVVSITGTGIFFQSSVLTGSSTSLIFSTGLTSSLKPILLGLIEPILAMLLYL